MSNTNSDIASHLLELIDRDRLLLPTLPEVALRIREAANSPDISSRKLSELLGSDAGISARLIRVANSPLMRAAQRIDNLPQAVTRLGITYSCNLAVGLAMAQMFQATNEVIDERLQQVWQRSIEVAAIATVLAKHYTGLKPDQVSLAALVHEIGVLPVLAYAEEHDLYTRAEEAAELDALIAATHPVIGEKILRSWHFPEALLPVPREHGDLQREAAQADLVDVIIVARLLSRADGVEHLPEEQWHTVSAFSRLGLRPARDVLEATDLSEEMQAAAQAMG